MQYCKLFIFLLLASCAAPKKSSSPNNTGSTGMVKDSIEFYEVDVEARQKNYLDLLMGGWNINTIKRQARMEEEALQNTFLVFTSDTTFNGKGGCNNIAGNYNLKGTGIKFSNIISTKMACENIAQESAFLQLLQQTVSTYSVSKDSLLLRDGSSNIVATATRRKE